MGKPALSLFLGAALCALLTSPCRAGFGYAGTFTDQFNRHEVHSPSDMSNLQFTDQTGDSLECDGGGTFLTVVKGTGYTGSNDPDPFDTPFTLKLTINDYDSNTSKDFIFTGRVTGSYSNRRCSVRAVYLASTLSAIIGTNTYTVTLMPLVAPEPPVLSAQFTEFQAFVTCAPTGSAISGVTITNPSVQTGRAIQGTVSLNGPAPMGGAAVTLTGSAAAISVPDTVFIPEGQATASFTGAALVAGTGIQVTAKWNGTTATSSELSITGALCGDVDGSGTLNMKDVVELLRAYAGLAPMPNC